MPQPIKTAEFSRAITHIRQAPPTLPAVVFAGRSNSGKSSLINRLTRHSHLARTSNTPGRTREIIYFTIDEQYYFIDLPGYGYAKVSESERQRWKPMMEIFFKKAEGLRLIVVILDVRRDPSADDLQMLDWLEARGLPYIFAVTKIDKLSRSQALRRLKEIQAALGLQDDSALIPVSSQTGHGIDDMLGVVRTALEARPPEVTPAADEL